MHLILHFFLCLKSISSQMEHVLYFMFSGGGLVPNDLALRGISLERLDPSLKFSNLF